jgi:hypothetical protein
VIRLIVFTVALDAMACGNGKVNSRTDAFVERPVIDPAPYYMVCSGNPSVCPAPYECTIPDLAHDPVDNVCLVPCSGNEQCPAGNICNGLSQTIEMGASNHCVVEE